MADEDLLPEPDIGSRENIADDVRAAFDKFSTEDVAKQLTTPEPESAADKAERLRDEHGKFVAKTVEPSAPEPITDADQPAAQPDQQSRAEGPPRGWSADEKAAWSTLPPAVQAAVSRREMEIDTGARQWSEQKRSYEQVLAPVQQLAQQYQMPHADVVERLVSVEQRLSDPRQAPQVIAELAQAYGVNLASLANGSQQPQPQALQFDPNLIPQLISQSLTQELSKRDEQTAIHRTIDSFASSPGHEHFDKVKVKMGRLLESGEASDMQDAYDQAIWANPSTRALLQVAQTPPAAQAARSRKAAVSLNGSPRGQAPANRSDSKGSVMDDVRAAFEQHAAEA